MNSLRHLTTIRRGGSISRSSPVSATRPSFMMIFQAEPAFQSETRCAPNQYFSVNSRSVSAVHNLSGVVRMKVTYTKLLAMIVSFSRIPRPPWSIADQLPQLLHQRVIQVRQHPHPGQLELADPALQKLVDRNRIDEMQLFPPGPLH